MTSLITSVLWHCRLGYRKSLADCRGFLSLDLHLMCNHHTPGVLHQWILVSLLGFQNRITKKRIKIEVKTSTVAHSVQLFKFIKVSFLGGNNVRRCFACSIQVENVAINVKKRLPPFKLWQQQFTQLFQSYTQTAINRLALHISQW